MEISIDRLAAAIEVLRVVSDAFDSADSDEQAKALEANHALAQAHSYLVELLVHLAQGDAWQTAVAKTIRVDLSKG